MDDFTAHLENRLPIRGPWITFEESHSDQEISVQATVPNLSTAEVLVTLNDEFDMTVKEDTDPSASYLWNFVVNMPKPKDLAAEKSADTKKQSQTPTQSRTSSTTTSSPPATTSARSDALLITKKEEVEKACFKLCRAGINLMKLYRNENTTIQKEIEASQKQALTELQELVKDLRE
ncbi:hypothetical protein GCK32_002308, partial [Trichostrongylus colubriformis]